MQKDNEILNGNALRFKVIPDAVMLKNGEQYLSMACYNKLFTGDLRDKRGIVRYEPVAERLSERTDGKLKLSAGLGILEMEDASESSSQESSDTCL